MLASTANVSPPTSLSVMQRTTTVSNSFAQGVALTETAVAVLREGRMIGNLAVESERAKTSGRPD
jgi:hypothetical protein